MFAGDDRVPVLPRPGPHALDVVLLLVAEVSHRFVRQLLEIVETLLSAEVPLNRPVQLPLWHLLLPISPRLLDLPGFCCLPLALLLAVLEWVFVDVGLLGQELRLDDFVDETLELERACRLCHILIAHLHHLRLRIRLRLVAPPFPAIFMAVLGVLG